MKKYIYILSLFLIFKMNAQNTEKVFVLFNESKDCKLKKIKTDNTIKYILKNKSDSLVMQKTKAKVKYIKKEKVDRMNKIDACDLIALGIKRYLELIENKKIYLVSKCKTKFETVEVDSLAFYEKAQN